MLQTRLTSSISFSSILFVTFFFLLTESLLAKDRLYTSPLYYGQGHAGMADASSLDSFYYNPANVKTYPDTTTPIETPCKAVAKEKKTHPHKKKASTAKNKKNDKNEKNPKLAKKKKAKTPKETLATCINQAAETAKKQDRYFVSIPILDFSSVTYDLLKTSNNDQRILYLKDNIGVPLYIRNAQVAIYATEQFTFSILEDMQAEALTSNDLDHNGVETIELSLHKTLSFSLAKAISFGQISLGLASHLIYSENAQQSAPITDFQAVKGLKNIQDTQGGWGLAIDTGIRYNFSEQLSFGLSILNLGNSSIHSSLLAGQHLDTLPQSLDAGLMYQFQFLGIKNKLLLDLRDLNHPTDSKAKKFHFGHALTILDAYTFSWGLNQGYFTNGITVQYKILLMTFGYYTEEKGEVAGFRPDNRYFLQLAIRG